MAATAIVSRATSEALLDKIRAEKAISDALAAELKTVFSEFKQTYR